MNCRIYLRKHWPPRLCSAQATISKRKISQYSQTPLFKPWGGAGRWIYEQPTWDGWATPQSKELEVLVGERGSGTAAPPHPQGSAAA